MSVPAVQLSLTKGARRPSSVTCLDWRSSGLHMHLSSKSCCCDCQDWLQYHRKLSAGHLAQPRAWLLPWVKLSRCWGWKVTEDIRPQAVSQRPTRSEPFFILIFILNDSVLPLCSYWWSQRNHINNLRLVYNLKKTEKDDKTEDRS